MDIPVTEQMGARHPEAARHLIRLSLLVFVIVISGMALGAAFQPPLPVGPVPQPGDVLLFAFETLFPFSVGFLCLPGYPQQRHFILGDISLIAPDVVCGPSSLVDTIGVFAVILFFSLLVLAYVGRGRLFRSRWPLSERSRPVCVTALAIVTFGTSLFIITESYLGVFWGVQFVMSGNTPYGLYWLFVILRGPISLAFGLAAWVAGVGLSALARAAWRLALVSYLATVASFLIAAVLLASFGVFFLDVVVPAAGVLGLSALFLERRHFLGAPGTLDGERGQDARSGHAPCGYRR